MKNNEEDNNRFYVFPLAFNIFYTRFGRNFGGVKYSFRGFYDKKNKRGIHTLNFIIEDLNNNSSIKYSIDWFDSNSINDYDAYEWCDVYAKVNTNWELTPKEKYPKIVSIGPSFGIKKNSLLRGQYYALRSAYKCGMSLKQTIHYMRYYYRESQRLPLSSYLYQPEKVENGYVFFLSTLWYNADWNNNDVDLNTPRYNMMLAVKDNKNIKFEGGFVAHNLRNINNGYKSSTEKFSNMIYPMRITAKEYQMKQQKSFVWLNTPAVVGCHGWKLAEALAYGKCIVSLPLVNDLPCPLEHGVNIHFVENTPESINNALNYIYNNPEYRKKLEVGARKYWEQYCSPTAALRLMGIITNN